MVKQVDMQARWQPALPLWLATAGSRQLHFVATDLDQAHSFARHYAIAHGLQFDSIRRVGTVALPADG